MLTNGRWDQIATASLLKSLQSPSRRAASRVPAPDPLPILAIGYRLLAIRGASLRRAPRNAFDVSLKIRVFSLQKLWQSFSEV